jgi:hypothetical protein
MVAAGNINILEFKDKLIITLFCSYDSTALTRIDRLKSCMVQKGYSRCKKVSDYSYPIKRVNEDMDQYFLRKSINWLEQSDACVFVFFAGVNNEGVTFELKHACDCLQNRLETSLVAIESSSSRISTSLIRGTITNLVMQQKLNRRFFKTEDQLCRFCSSAAISFVKTRIFYLIDRYS